MLDGLTEALAGAGGSALPLKRLQRRLGSSQPGAPAKKVHLIDRCSVPSCDTCAVSHVVTCDTGAGEGPSTASSYPAKLPTFCQLFLETLL